MDKESLELIAIAHDSYAEFTGDHYERIRTSLDNRLGVLALEAVNDAEDAVRNRTLLQSLVEQLPNVDSQGRFHLDSRADVRWVQNSVIWTSDEGGHDTAPFYIIGETRKRSRTSLLLHRVSHGSGHSVAHGPIGSLLVADIRRKDYDNMREHTKSNLFKPLSLEEMNELYDSGSNEFIVGWTYPPENIMVTDGVSYMGLLGQMERYLTGLPRIKYTDNLSKAISDLDISKFNVIASIIHLSSAFNRNDAVREVIDSWRQVDKGEQLQLFEYLN